jgi:hypothetical protein
MSDKKPFRGEVRFCVVASDIDDAEMFFSQVEGFVETIGAFPQGGHVGLMDDEDVIKGSPLEDALRA